MAGGNSVRLAGVILWTEQARFPAMRDFYVDVLGLAPRSERDGFVNFDWDGTRLTVTTHDEVRGASAEPFRVMVNFAVGDLDAFHHRLTQSGVRCLRSPAPEHWGGRIATYADPDGNLLQLLELPS